VIVDAEGIDDVGEGTSGGRRGSRHDSIFIGFMCPRNCDVSLLLRPKMKQPILLLLLVTVVVITIC